MDDSKRTEARKGFVMLTSVLPSSPADNAGARYVHWVANAVANRFEFLALVPDGPAAHRARQIGQVPRHKLLGGAEVRSITPAKAFFTKGVALVFPVRVPWRFVRDLVNNSVVRKAVRQAEIIDLQWQEQGLLIPLLRILNPRARIVCTFHDVLSQRFKRARDSAKSPLPRARWTWAALTARLTEQQILRQADAVIVFSEKDARLLPTGKAKIHIVVPPLAAGMERIQRSSPVSGEILFVGALSRWENEEGLLWFLSDVWPLVRASVPEARFRIAGGGIRPAIQTAADVAGADLLGFVPNLAPLYEQASVVVAPLRLGAGVKFKVIDALAAGVPVVTTTVGAEGIGDPSWFAGLDDDAQQFANAVVETLHRPGLSVERVENIRRDVLKTYGHEQFDHSIATVYSMTPIGSH
ncbi:glycosyltransferase involved in cell wall biosynthesis [Arthrobacter sp. UYEF6]